MSSSKTLFEEEQKYNVNDNFVLSKVEMERPKQNR